jgi:hypothetical protein
MAESPKRKYRMSRHIGQIAAISLVALTCMFYPFLPGTHDRLAVTLSMMARMLGWGGLLLLVPIGAVWLSYELIKRKATTLLVSRQDKGHYFAVATMAASIVAAAAAALAALTHTGVSLGIGVLLFWAYVVWRFVPAWKRLKKEGAGGFNPTPLYLLFVPSILVVAQLTLLKPAVEFSRKRAILGSREFINAIEAYHAAHGQYPPSLASEVSDYDPSVIGVERYHYEPSGRAYNVFFEQLTFPIGMREFVMYNPLDEHTFMVHDQDILESPQEQVDAERRFHALHHAYVVPPPSPPHWKYFWFD